MVLEGYEDFDAPEDVDIPDLDDVRAKPEADDMLSVPLDSGMFNLPQRLMEASEEESELVPWAWLTPDQAAIMLELEVEKQLEQNHDLDIDAFTGLYMMLSVAKEGRGREDAKAVAGSIGQAAAAQGGGGGLFGRFRNKGV